MSVRDKKQNKQTNKIKRKYPKMSSIARYDLEED